MSTAVFMNVSGGGHVIATYGLVKELVDRGETVHYFEDPLFQNDIEALGAIFHPMPQAQRLDLQPLGDPFHHELDLAVAMVWCAKSFVPNLLPQVKKLNPDYLVHDSLCLWGKIIALQLKIPGICSVHPPAFNLKAAFLSFRMWKDAPKMLFLWQKIKGHFKQLKAELETTYNLEPIGFYDSFTNPQGLTICHLPEELQPFRKCFDKRFHFVGSVHRRPSKALTKFKLNELKPGLIYVGFGTICDPGPEFFKTCINALSKIDRQAIVILSHSTSKEDLGPVPENIQLWSLKDDGMAPQMDILPLASLFIMNGGTGGSRESCWFGVPMLAIPTTFETECVSLQMQKMGAGLVLDKRCTELEMSTAIQELLQNPSYAKRSRYIGDQCKKSGGAQRATDLILNYVKYSSRSKNSL
jgi:MGT family glycosyltransferase